MNKNEQIQEMANAMCGLGIENCQECEEYILYGYCDLIRRAEILYSKGYRRVPRGEWIPYGMNMNGTVGNWKCSVCNETSIKASDYCPHCGADMRKEQNNDER